MMGAGDLFSSPQPVTAKPVRPLPLKGALRGLPQKGAAETQGSDAGEGLPLQARSAPPRKAGGPAREYPFNQ
jgi:hypothetical protein